MLKIDFEDPMWDSVVKHSKVEDLFEQNSNVITTPTGRYVETVNMIGYNEGVGARPADRGYLPVPGNPTFVNGRIKLKKTLAVAQMTYFVMKQAVKSKAAFAGWAEVELTKTERGLRADLDRQTLGYGSGIVCQIDGAPAAGPPATIPIDNPYGLLSDVKGWLPGIGRGTNLVAGPNPDGSGLRAGGQSTQVLSLNKSANAGGGQLTVTIIPAGWVDNDYLWRGDDVDNAAPHQGVEVETGGLLGFVDDGTILPLLQNIDRTLIDEWKAQVIDGSLAPYSGAATDILFMRACQDVYELGGGDVDVFLTTTAIFRNAFFQFRAVQGGYLTNGPAAQGEMHGGAKGITVWIGDQQVEIRAVPKLFPGYALGLDTSTLQRHSLENFEWDDTVGSTFRQVADGGAIQDAFYAYGRVIQEKSIRDPQKCVLIKKLSETLVG